MRGTTGTATRRERLTGQFRALFHALVRAFHSLVRAWPSLLLTVLLAALALPAGMLIAPGLSGAAQSVPEPSETPGWQLEPEWLSVPQGIGPLSTTAPVPVPAEVAARLDPVLRTDGGGSFTGVVQDAA